MITLHLCSSFRQRWQFARPRWGGEHQRGFLHCGSDPACRSQTSVFWRGGLSGRERRRSASSVMLRGAEDFGGDLHSQTAQQLSQVLQRKSSQTVWRWRRPKSFPLTAVFWPSGLNYSSGGPSRFSPVSPVWWLVSGITTASSSPLRIFQCLRCRISPRYIYLLWQNSWICRHLWHPIALLDRANQTAGSQRCAWTFAATSCPLLSRRSQKTIPGEQQHKLTCSPLGCFLIHACPPAVLCTSSPTSPTEMWPTRSTETPSTASCHSGM